MPDSVDPTQNPSTTETPKGPVVKVSDVIVLCAWNLPELPYREAFRQLYGGSYYGANNCDSFFASGSAGLVKDMDNLGKLFEQYRG